MDEEIEREIILDEGGSEGEERSVFVSFREVREGFV